MLWDEIRRTVALTLFDWALKVHLHETIGNSERIAAMAIIERARQAARS